MITHCPTQTARNSPAGADSTTFRHNQPMIQSVIGIGRADLIGNGKRHLVPAWQPTGTCENSAPARRREAPAIRGKIGASRRKKPQ